MGGPRRQGWGSSLAAVTNRRSALAVFIINLVASQHSSFKFLV